MNESPSDSGEAALELIEKIVKEKHIDVNRVYIIGLSMGGNLPPEMLTSGSRVYSHDYDKDGDLDLFVGGRLVPGNYPSPAKSYLLENISKKGVPKFKDVTNSIAPDIEKLGLVTDAS